MIELFIASWTTGRKRSLELPSRGGDRFYESDRKKSSELRGGNSWWRKSVLIMQMKSLSQEPPSSSASLGDADLWSLSLGSIFLWSTFRLIMGPERIPVCIPPPTVPQPPHQSITLQGVVFWINNFVHIKYKTHFKPHAPLLFTLLKPIYYDYSLCNQCPLTEFKLFENRCLYNVS